MMSKFKKEGLFYRGEKKGWEMDLYGFYPRGLGDLIFNTMDKIVRDKDTSEWAHKSFKACKVLLIQRKRWPYSMNNDRIAKNVLGQRGSELLHRVLPKRYPLIKYRSQRSMTRDPWIAMYAAGLMLGYKSHLKAKIPFDLYRPKVWAWRRIMLGKCSLYNIWCKIPSKKEKLDYVKRLDELIEYSYNKVFNYEDTSTKKRN